MKPLFVSLAVTTVGVTIYHLGQKTLPQSANPMVLLVAAYTVALVGATLSIPFFRTASEPAWTAQVFNWPVLVLGAGALLIELGFLLVYRRGGGLQWAGVAVNAASALLLIPLGLAYFREGFSAGRMLGTVLTLVGMVLMMRK